MATYNAWDPANSPNLFDPFGDIGPDPFDPFAPEPIDYAAAPEEEKEEENYFEHMLPEMSLDTDAYRDQQEEVRESMEAYESHSETRPDENIFGGEGAGWKEKLKSDGARNIAMYLANVLGAINSGGNPSQGISQATSQLASMNERSRQKLQVDWETESRRLQRELMADKDRAGYMLQTAKQEDEIIAWQKKAEEFEKQTLWASKTINNTMEIIGDGKTPEEKTAIRDALAGMYARSPESFSKMMGAIGTTMPGTMDEDITAAMYLTEANMQEVKNNINLVILENVGEQYGMALKGEIAIALNNGGDVEGAVAFMKGNPGRWTPGAIDWMETQDKQIQLDRDLILWKAKTDYSAAVSAANRQTSARVPPQALYDDIAEIWVSSQVSENWESYAISVADKAGIAVPESIQTPEEGKAKVFAYSKLEPALKADMFAAASAANAEGSATWLEYGETGVGGAISSTERGAYDASIDDELKGNPLRIARAAETAEGMNLTPQEILFAASYEETMKTTIQAQSAYTQGVERGAFKPFDRDAGVGLPPMFEESLGGIYGYRGTGGGVGGPGNGQEWSPAVGRAVATQQGVYNIVAQHTDPISAGVILERSSTMFGSTFAGQERAKEEAKMLGGWQLANRDANNNIPTPQSEEQTNYMLDYINSLYNYAGARRDLPVGTILGQGVVGYLAINDFGAVSHEKLMQGIMDGFKSDDAGVTLWFQALELGGL